MNKSSTLYCLLIGLLLSPLHSSFAQSELDGFDDLTDEPQTLPAGQESDLQKRTGTVAEEELLKTKTPRNPKVVAQKKAETEIYVAEADKFRLTDSMKNLQLNDIIEQGLRKNYDQNIKGQEQELNEITFQGAKSEFWMPKLSIDLQTEPQKLTTLHSAGNPPLNPHSTSPAGTLGLTLGEYTVFNWGKDYALYLNQKSSYERKSAIYKESERELKLDLINSYFTLMTSKNIEKIFQDKLRRTSFLYRLNKEKITVGKTTKQDYYLARSEYLKSQNEFHEARIITDQTDEKVAFQIADPIGTKYIINENLDYKRIRVSLDDILAIAQQNNPGILTSKVMVENAHREYDVALKNNMPLPKFSLNLGAYNKRFGPTTNVTGFETYSGSGNIELVASINTSWALTGDDGLFNSRLLAKSRIGRDISEKTLEKHTHLAQSMIRQTYKTILSLQNQILILEARLPSLQNTLDTVLENYLAGRSKFHDYSLALEDFTNTKVFYEQTKLQHLNEKLQLAKLAGLEDFPGENFEQLATRIKGK